MAAREEEEMTSKWQNRLPDHSVFRELRNKDEDNSLQTAEDAKESKTKNIFLENDGELFVWNSAKSSLLTANLKNLHFDNERADKFQVSERCIFFSLIDCLCDRLIDLLTDWFVDWLIDWLIDRLIDWLVYWLNDWLIEWLIDWLTDYWLVNWLTDLQSGTQIFYT